MSENQLTVAEPQPPNQPITIEPAKYVELVFEPFAKQLSGAIDSIRAVDYDVKTTAGMSVAVKCRALFRAIRVECEKARKTRKAPILEIGRLLDSRYAEIESSVLPIETFFDDDIKAEESRKEAEKQAKAAAEKARVDGIRTKIDTIRATPAKWIGKPSAEIGVAADHLSETVIDLDGWQEFAGEAVVERDRAVKQMREMQAKQAEHEAEQDRLAAERAELERLRAEGAERERIAAEERAETERQAKLARDREDAERARIDSIRERIAQIKATVAMQAGKPSASIESAISAIETSDTEGFEEFASEAAEAYSSALTQLRDMHTSVLDMERVQAEIARQQAELKRQQEEQERREREAKEAAEAKARAEKLETDHVEALVENARVDAERAAEKERIRRQRADFEAIGPDDWEILQVLADHYDVTTAVVRHWLGRHVWMEKAA